VAKARNYAAIVRQLRAKADSSTFPEEAMNLRARAKELEDKHQPAPARSTGSGGTPFIDPHTSTDPMWERIRTMMANGATIHFGPDVHVDRPQPGRGSEPPPPGWPPDDGSPLFGGRRTTFRPKEPTAAERAQRERDVQSAERLRNLRRAEEQADASRREADRLKDVVDRVKAQVDRDEANLRLLREMVGESEQPASGPQRPSYHDTTFTGPADQQLIDLLTGAGQGQSQRSAVRDVLGLRPDQQTKVTRGPNGEIIVTVRR
jgi:hypothetical protein